MYVKYILTLTELKTKCEKEQHTVGIFKKNIAQ